MKDIDEYDKLCKVEPMNRALKEQNSDGWINGRRRDHGAERAALPVWEGKKVNPLAMWTFEDCWTYCRFLFFPFINLKIKKLLYDFNFLYLIFYALFNYNILNII